MRYSSVAKTKVIIRAAPGTDAQNLSQYNVYAYCFHNPINMANYMGNRPSWGQIITVVVAVVAVAVVRTGGTCYGASLDFSLYA